MGRHGHQMVCQLAGLLVVGHQDDRDLATECTERVLHQRRRHPVKVCGGLVEKQHGGTGPDAGEAARQRNTPQLARAQFGRMVPGEVPGSRCGQAILCRLRSCRRVKALSAVEVQEDLVEHGVRHHDRMLWNPGDGVALQAGEAAGHCGSAAVPDSPGQHAKDSAFAGAAGTVEGGDQPVRGGEGQGPDGGSGPCGIGDSEVGDAHSAGPGHGKPAAAVVRGRFATLCRQRPRLGSVSDFPGLGQGGPAVITGVVGGAQLAQRKIAVRREDQRQEAGFEWHLAVHQADADEHGNHCYGNRGDEFQRQCGQERGAQCPHCPGAVFLRDLLKGFALRRGTAQSHQDGQPLGQLQHVGRKPGQGFLGLADVVLGVPADQHHKQRDQRNRQDNHHRADPVGEQDASPEQQRDRGAVHQCREELGVVAVQRVQPARGQHGEPAVGRAGAARTVPQGPGQQFGP